MPRNGELSDKQRAAPPVEKIHKTSIIPIMFDEKGQKPYETSFSFADRAGLQPERDCSVQGHRVGISLKDMNAETHYYF